MEGDVCAEQSAETLSVGTLREGMVVGEDITDGEGALLVPRWMMMTPPILELVRSEEGRTACRDISSLTPVEGELRALIADGEEAGRALVVEHLTPLGRCDAAASARDALAAYRDGLERDRPHDLICVDSSLPDADGLELVARILRLWRSSVHGRNDRPRIILTARSLEYERIMEAFVTRCDSCLEKPVSRERLLKQMVLLGLLH
jgi:two-component system chemotaxis response regulator CheY